MQYASKVKYEYCKMSDKVDQSDTADHIVEQNKGWRRKPNIMQMYSTKITNIYWYRIVNQILGAIIQENNPKNNQMFFEHGYSYSVYFIAPKLENNPQSSHSACA